MPEIKVTEQRCKGCGLCVLYCPKGSLRMSVKFNSKGYHFPECSDIESCTGCALCGVICPEVAIEVYK
jgi:2-oxoglutarate ferredoxin oxidoreductase subunit delta